MQTVTVVGSDEEARGVQTLVNSSLILAYRGQEISAEDIVRSAVKDKKLPPEVLSDKKYVNAVRNQLDALLIDNLNRR